MVGFALYLLTCVVILGLLARRLRASSYGVAFGVTFGLLYYALIPLGASYVMGWTPPFMGMIHAKVIDPWLEQGLVGSLLGAILVWGTVDWMLMGLDGSLKDPAPEVFQSRSASPFWVTVLTVASLVTFYNISGLSQGGHWARDREQYLLESGMFGIAVGVSVWALKMAFMAAGFVALIRHQIRLRTMLLLMGIVCMVDLLATGNRIFTLYCVLLMILALWQRRQRLAIVLLLLLAFPFGVLMTMFSTLRVYMHRYGFENMMDGLDYGWYQASKHHFRQGRWYELIAGSTEGTDLTMSLNIIRDYPEVKDLLHGWPLLRPFVFWIPRSVWPSKPYSTSVLIAREYAPQVKSLSLGCTLVGETWANFGLVSLLVMPLFVMVFWVIIRMMFPNRLEQMVMGTLIGFAIVRGPAADIVLPLAGGWVILQCFSRLAIRAPQSPPQFPRQGAVELAGRPQGPG